MNGRACSSCRAPSGPRCLRYWNNYSAVYQSTARLPAAILPSRCPITGDHSHEDLHTDGYLGGLRRVVDRTDRAQQTLPGTPVGGPAPQLEKPQQKVVDAVSDFFNGSDRTSRARPARLWTERCRTGPAKSARFG